jgi:succinate dehydrogenase / fumarate reductase iron-sulfur subunit
MNGETKPHPDKITIRINRGEAGETQGRFEEFQIPYAEGMVVLDAVIQVQKEQAPDLALRWNCKAARCGSCSAEINGKPRLQCKTRVMDLDLTQPITVSPLRTFPRIKDLVTDVSWNYRVNRSIPPMKFAKNPPKKVFQSDVDRAQEMRKCIECFLCQDVCHVLRYQTAEKPTFIGPRFIVRTAGLDMNPFDEGNRTEFLLTEAGLGMCNITKCCTEVCPEEIHITDNAIIPEKERVVDAHADPLRAILNGLFGKSKENGKS